MKTGIMNYSVYKVEVSLIFLAAFFCVNLYAQPSGGPYGPVDMNYTLPLTKGNIYVVAPDGKAENAGKIFEKPTTIEAAVEKARTGDVIILRGGTYRTGNLRFNQGITLQPYKNEKPLFKGTYIVKGWKKVGNGLWATTWPHLFPGGPEDWWRRDREEARTPLYKFNDDMVFIDGRFLQSGGSTEEVDENTFYIDYNNKLVYIGIDPTDKLVEITAFNVAIHRTYKDYKGIPSDGIGPVILGIAFTQYADTAILIDGTYPEGVMDEAEYGNDVTGTVLENVEISYCSRIGAYLMGDSLTIRHCKVSNTSTEGIYLVGASDALLEGNIFTRNNIEYITGYFPAAVKIFDQCYRVTCRDNLVIDLPNSNGIWYDVGNVDGVFINNWVENVGDAKASRYSVYKYMSGFFFEISKGAICAGNVFLNCDNGSFVLNSSDVELYQNTYINSKVVFGRTERNATNDHFGWHPATGPGVNERDGHVFFNNLIVRNNTIQNPLLEVWQAPGLCDSLSSLQLKQLDHNVYVTQTAKDITPLIIWSTLKEDNCEYRLNTPEELNKMKTDFAGNSLYFKNYSGSLFLGANKKHFQLSNDFPGVKDSGLLPEKIRILLELKTDSESYIGAYPSIE